MAIDFNRLRAPMNTGTGYRIYDTFMDKVLPGIKGARMRNRQYQEGLTQGERDFEMDQMDRQNAFQLQRDRLGQIGDMQMHQFKRASEPMNVVIDRSQEITPRMREDFRLREKEIDRKSEWDEVRQALQGDTLEETIRKNQAAEALKKDSIEVQRFRAEHPNAKEVRQPNGSILFINPATGREIANFGPSGEIGKKEEIETKAAADIKTEATRQTGREELAEDKGWQTVNIEGKPFRYNPVTNQLQPINAPGPISRPGTDTTAKDAAAATEKAAKLEAVRSQAREAIATIGNIANIDNKGNLSLRPEMMENVGLSHYPSRLRNLFPTSSREAQKTADRLKKETILNLIGEMKAQSKTGATGFGALNLKELGVLEGAANQLDEAGSEEAYTRELKRIYDKLQLIMQDEPGSEAKPATPADSRTRAMDLIKKYGG